MTVLTLGPGEHPTPIVEGGAIRVGQQAITLENGRLLLKAFKATN